MISNHIFTIELFKLKKKINKLINTYEKNIINIIHTNIHTNAEIVRFKYN